jgi:hypothetical protein
MSAFWSHLPPFGTFCAWLIDGKLNRPVRIKVMVRIKQLRFMVVSPFAVRLDGELWLSDVLTHNF